MKKPKFEEVINLLDVGLRFNAQKVSSMTFKGLRETNYGKGFRMPIIPELVPLIYASLENKDYDTAKNIIETLKNYLITGDTAIHYFPEGMFVEDNPTMKNGIIVTPTQKELEKRLDSHEERRVRFSDDGSVRFTPYDFKKGSQTPLKLSTNTGIIALVSGEENAEKLAKASEKYKEGPYFKALKNVDSPITRIATLDSDSVKFYVLADDYAAFGDRLSFGVSEGAENPQKPLKSQ